MHPGSVIGRGAGVMILGAYSMSRSVPNVVHIWRKKGSKGVTHLEAGNGSKWVIHLVYAQICVTPVRRAFEGFASISEAHLESFCATNE